MQSIVSLSASAVVRLAVPFHPHSTDMGCRWRRSSPWHHSGTSWRFRRRPSNDIADGTCHHEGKPHGTLYVFRLRLCRQRYPNVEWLVMEMECVISVLVWHYLVTGIGTIGQFITICIQGIPFRAQDCNVLQNRAYRG